MHKGFTVGVATSPQQFVGYWGCGDAVVFQHALAKLCQPTGGSRWTIANHPASDGTLVALSASGLSNGCCSTADVWAHINNDGLALGRQAFGRVTLYWLQCDRAIWFASRLQLLRPLVSSPQISIPALYGYSCFSYVPTPLTPITQIAAIAAGTETYWTVSEFIPRSRVILDWCETDDQIYHEAEAIAPLQTLLEAAVERQIGDLHDETVGVFLSGGLDSAIVAALLVRAGVKVRAYSLDFGKSGVSEYAYAEQVARSLGIPLIRVDTSPQRIQSALLPTIQALDVPFGDGVTVPLFLLNHAASQDTGIVFNGEGGDQLFAGWTNKPLIASSIYQTEHPEGNMAFGDRYLQTFHRLWGYEAHVFQPSIYDEVCHLQPQDWLQSALDPTATHSLLHRLRRATLMLKGAQNIQPRATNLAFACGLQVRSLFCDLPLTQWTFQLAGELCLQGACEKYILKRAVETWLPPEIVWRQKRGMGVPLTMWCCQEWWRSLGTWLNPGILQAEGIWQPDLAARVALGKLGGSIQGRRIGEILWLLVVWQQWRSQVLGASTGKPTLNHPFWLPYAFWRYGKQWF